MLIVQKYGGTSLGDGEKVMNAARRAVALARQGIRIVMVVSAQGDTTDEMIQRARQINRRGGKREMDAYLACGEQMSAALMSMAIGALGWPALSLTGPQAGVYTDSVHGNARIQSVEPERIHTALEAGKIVVVAGFQGVDSTGDVTTLGRGGSDTTAVALAAALRADKCQIFTDVDGVYDRDPRLYADARKFARIGYEDMLTLVENGAQVLHDRSVELARDKGILVEVLSAFSDAPGTIVGG
jgi:aspartate kinase